MLDCVMFRFLLLILSLIRVSRFFLPSLSYVVILCPFRFFLTVSLFLSSFSIHPSLSSCITFPIHLPLCLRFVHLSFCRLFFQGDDDLEEEGMSWDELEKQAKREDTNKRDWEGDQPAPKPSKKRRR